MPQKKKTPIPLAQTSLKNNQKIQAFFFQEGFRGFLFRGCLTDIHSRESMMQNQVIHIGDDKKRTAGWAGWQVACELKLLKERN